MFIKSLLCARHCCPIAIGLYIQILPLFPRLTSGIWSIHHGFEFLCCLFIMFSFINWLNYHILKKKSSWSTSTQHKRKWPLPLVSATAGAKPSSSGPHCCSCGCRHRPLCVQRIRSVTGLHFSDSSSQPHNHTTHLESQFLEMTVSERFIVGTNSQQN